MPSQDVWKFTPVSYRTSALWGRCPALTPLLQLSLQAGLRVPLTTCDPWMTCFLCLYLCSDFLYFLSLFLYLNFLYFFCLYVCLNFLYFLCLFLYQDFFQSCVGDSKTHSVQRSIHQSVCRYRRFKSLKVILSYSKLM